MTIPADHASLTRQFKRDLQMEGKAAGTIETYIYATVEFGTYLATLAPQGIVDEGVIVEPAAISSVTLATRDHIKGYLRFLRERDQISTKHSARAGRKLSAATINNRYRALQAFFKWIVAEEIIDHSPLDTIKPPKIGETIIPVLSEDQHRALLATCGKGRRRPFTDLRDEALIRLLADAGPRRSEVANIMLPGLDIDLTYVRVLGKGNKERDIPFGKLTAKALDHYVLSRAGHRQAEFYPNHLWLAPKGALSAGGIYQMVKRRGRLIGIDSLHPHQFRHTYAHLHLASGGQETDLMRIAGWSSRSMIARYGASAADERARAAHAALAIGDRF